MADNIVDLLKEDLQELAENRDVFLPVAGYDNSGLAIRYVLPESGKQLDLIARKVERDYKDRWDRGLFTAIDTMIALCEGLYVKPAGHENYHELDPEESGFAAKFDGRLASMVGLPEDSTARTVVRKLFGNNDMALLEHSAKLARWITNTKADLNVELWEMGEA